MIKSGKLCKLKGESGGARRGEVAPSPLPSPLLLPYWTEPSGQRVCRHTAPHSSLQNVSFPLFPTGEEERAQGEGARKAERGVSHQHGGERDVLLQAAAGAWPLPPNCSSWSSAALAALIRRPLVRKPNDPFLPPPTRRRGGGVMQID